MGDLAGSNSLSNSTYSIYAVYIVVLFTLGVPVHILSLRFILKHILHRHKSRELSPYLLNICTANFISLIIQFPLVFVSSMEKGWSSLGRLPCYFTGITCGACSTVVILTLALMSVKLYRTVELDLGHHDESTNPRRTNPIKLIATWIVSFLTFIPTCFGWNSMVSDGPHCSPNWRVNSISDASYLIVIAMVSFLIPVVVFVLYFIKMSRYLIRHHNHESCTLHQLRLRVLHIDARNLIGILALVHVILWMPYWLYGFSNLFGHGGGNSGDLAILPWLFVSLSVIYFPFMYVALNKRFRHTLMSMLGCKRSQVNPVISVEKTESFDVLSSCNGVTPQAGSPTILVPRSPLVNRAFRLSVFEEVAEEIVKQQRPWNKHDLATTAVSRLIRCSLHAAHEPKDEHSRERRNTSVI